MDKTHIIGYCLLALCFVVAYFLGNELNPKVKPKKAANNEQIERD
jgi:hypothetical protein